MADDTVHTAEYVRVVVLPPYEWRWHPAGDAPPDDGVVLGGVVYSLCLVPPGGHDA